MTLKRLSTAALVLLPVAAQAQDAFIEGVYLATPELCQQARSEGLQTVVEGSAIVLTTRGFDAIEHNCRFLDINVREGGGAWLAQALCEEPGYAYPELFALVEREPGRLEITGLSGRFQGGAPAASEAMPPEAEGSGAVTPGENDTNLKPEGGAEPIVGDEAVGMADQFGAGEPFTYTLCEGVEMP
ncbi:MAG TPA: hypothetical protein VGN97_10045 [Mesorhizobium sp.]|jgi:hypothetical protein|nr:hypothetical protein [Mesorhizobium sp.]